MWLLDANMDVNLVRVLARLGIRAETAGSRGWKAFSNGQLVAAAVASGFECLLTRDRQFGESAAKALREHPQFAVVLILLRQQRSDIYPKRFLELWSEAPIIPEPGRLLAWPTGVDCD